MPISIPDQYNYLPRYNVVFMILTYFLPIGSMTFTYARIGLELWGSQSIGEATQRQLDNIRNKRRVRRASYPYFKRPLPHRVCEAGVHVTSFNLTACKLSRELRRTKRKPTEFNARSPPPFFIFFFLASRQPRSRLFYFDLFE
jgi:hypothetical protein